MSDFKNEKAEARRLRNIKVPTAVTVPSDDLLQNPEYVQMLAIVLWCLNWRGRHASRRTFVDIGSDVLRDFEGKILNADGTPFAIDDLDEALGGPHFDWLRYLFAMPLGEAWKPQGRHLDRLKVVAAIVKSGGPILWRDLWPEAPEEEE